MVTANETILNEQSRADEIIIPRELHHINIRTAQLDQMIAFYEKLVGMRCNFRNSQFAAITFDDANHRIALLALPFFKPAPGTPADRFQHAGFEHVAFEYDRLDQLLHNYLRLERQGISPYWTVNHGPTMSFYYRDPDGNAVELQVDCCEHSLERWKQILDGPLFKKNVVGPFVDPHKMVEARKRGVSEQAILSESYKEGQTPYSGPEQSPFV